MTLKPVPKGMGHLDPTAEHKSPQLPCTLACYGVQWRQQLLAFVLGFSLPHPHSFLSSPPYDILLFFLPYLTKVERGKKRGKHPEGGGGGKEEKENKDEKTKKDERYFRAHGEGWIPSRSLPQHN